MKISGEIKQKRLEAELELEKLRFSEASKNAARAIKRDLTLVNWLNAYPFETTALFAFASFAVGYAIGKAHTLDIRTNF